MKASLFLEAHLEISLPYWTKIDPLAVPLSDGKKQKYPLVETAGFGPWLNLDADGWKERGCQGGLMSQPYGNCYAGK
jgi:hypothetical protein